MRRRSAGSATDERRAPLSGHPRFTPASRAPLQMSDAHLSWATHGSCRARGPRYNEAGQAAQGHVDPRGTVVELVAHLVERLVELEDGEGAVERRTRARAEPDGRLRRRGQAPVEERLDRQPPPGVADRRSRALPAER